MKLIHKLVSQLLIACMIFLPFTAQGGMIGTDQAISSVQDQMNRDKVRDFVTRTDVVKQFEALGLNASTAQERVNAMTQQEINRIAGKIDSIPAGASSSGVWIAVGLIVIGLAVWYFYK